MEINIEVSGFLSNNKRTLKISNFELCFIKKNEKTNTTSIEMKCHIKYINLKDRNNTKIILERKDINEKYSIKTSSTEDMDNLISTLNKDYNLIEGDSFMDYFTSVKEFLQVFIRNLDTLFLNPELEKLLDLINILMEKIDYYLGVINNNENSFKEQNEQIYLESKEIKELLSNLKEAIGSCTFGLHKEEVKDYVNNFKNIVKEKSQEINILIDEIKYNLSNYLALGLENEENKNEIFESKEEEFTKVLLENESLKLQNENLINENQIISQFLIENKNKK